MLLKLLKESIDIQKSERKMQKPITFFILFFVFLLLALLFHPFDIQYKIFLQKYAYLDSELSRIGILTSIIRAFGKFGCLIIIAVTLGAIGYKKLCYKLLVSLFIMAVIVWSFKPLVHRERPNGIDYHSFPSGDTATATTFYFTLASNVPSLTPVIVVPAAVGFLRNYQNWHYLSDVLAGIAFGFLAVGISLKLDLRRNRFVCKIKARYWTLLTLFLLFIMYIYSYIKSNRDIWNFVNICGAAILLIILTEYSRLLFRNSIAINKETYLLRSWMKIKGYIKAKFSDNIPDVLIEKLSFCFAVLGVTSSMTSWLCNWWNLVYPISGIGLLSIAQYYLYKKHMKLKNTERLRVMLPIVMIIFLLICFLCLCPEVVKFVIRNV